MFLSKKILNENIARLSNELVSLTLKFNILEDEYRRIIDKNNKLVDCVKLLDKKNTLLADCFQLEFKGNSFRKKRK